MQAVLRSAWGHAAQGDGLRRLAFLFGGGQGWAAGRGQGSNKKTGSKQTEKYFAHKMSCGNFIM